MSDYILKHHGIKGQKWGRRRYQNEDGSLTTAGSKRYGIRILSRNGSHGSKDSKTNPPKTKKPLSDEERAARRKKAIKIGAAVAGTAVVSVGAYKLNKYRKENASLIKNAENMHKQILETNLQRTYDDHLNNLRKDYYTGKISSDRFNKGARKLIDERDFIAKGAKTGTDGMSVQMHKAYERRRSEIESKVKSGKITPRQASSAIFELNQERDKMLARMGLWKYGEK